MTGLESEKFFIQKREPPNITFHKEFDIAPKSIVTQTNTLLELFRNGSMIDPQPAVNYLQDCTLPCLRRAKQGAASVYSRTGKLFEDLKLDAREAASYALVVFSVIPDRLTSYFFPDGFSRQVMVRPPETRDEFLKRIEELRVGLWKIIDGRVSPDATLEANTALLRTYAFFKVGSQLSVKMAETAKAKRRTEDESLGKLLDGIEISI